MPTAYYVPTIVPGPILVARNERAAIVISHLEVFPDGVEIPVALYTRDDDLIFEQLDRRRDDERRLLAPYGVDLRVTLPGGVRLSIERPYEPVPEPGRTPIELARAGIDTLEGRGTGSYRTFRVFQFPLPDVTVTIELEWSELELLASAEVKGEVLLAAAKRVTAVWEDDAGLPSHHGHDRPRRS